MTADLLNGSMNAPQSLIRYSYTMDDPINAIDPFGLCTGFIGRDKNGEPIFGTVACDNPQNGDGDGAGSTGGGGGGGGGGAGGCGGPCGGSGGGGGGGGPRDSKRLQAACKILKQQLDDAENNAHNNAFPRAFTEDFLIGEGVAAIGGCIVGGLFGSEGGPPGGVAGCGVGAVAAVGNPEISGGIFVTSMLVATVQGYEASKKADEARNNFESVCQ